MEHCRLTHISEGELGGEHTSRLEVVFMTGDGVRTEYMKSITDAIQALGVQGWELVAILPGDNKMHWANDDQDFYQRGDEYFFKRQESVAKG